MRKNGIRRGGKLGKTMATGLLIGALAAGCGKSPPPQGNADGNSGQPPAGAAVQAAPQYDPFLHQSFEDATTDGQPTNCRCPPAQTIAQKSVGKLYTQVKQAWNDIKFTTPDGKPFIYRAIVETDRGNIEIALRPDLAPNHVRSFVALARAGYFDGLMFERTVHPKEDDVNQQLDMIEGGCPLGTGEEGFGSIGYWLKSETNVNVAHEEGTVGAWPEVWNEQVQVRDADACKFYITLCDAPSLDRTCTVFGKVTRGLEIAKLISTLPVRSDAEDTPLEPVKINKVRIEVDK